MRALENYNRQRDKKLGVMVGACMKSLGICYLLINVIWMLLTLISGGYQKGIVQKGFLPMLLPFVMYVLYYWLIVKKERELHHIITYIILNVYLLVLLAHPSGLSVLDGLLFGVIATFPIWTDQRWAKIQVIIFAILVVIRHLVIYAMDYRVVDFWRLTNLFGMFCIGGLVYYIVIGIVL